MKLSKTGTGWKIDFNLSKKRYIKVFQSKALAEAYYNKLKTDHVNRKFFGNVVIEKHFFKELADKFYTLHLLVNTASPKQELVRVKVLTRYFGEYTRLDAIKFSDLEKWKSALLEKVSASTVNRYISTLKSMFSKAGNWGMIAQNVAKKLEKIPRADIQREVYLTKQQVQNLLDKATPILRLFILFAVSTGARKSNILSTTWENVDLKNRVINFPMSKSGIRYSVPISNRLFAELNAVKDKKGFVIDPTNLRRNFSNLTKECGLKIRVHDLRHTFASSLVQSGANILTVSKLLGHKDLKMVSRYAHLADKMKSEAVNNLPF